MSGMVSEPLVLSELSNQDNKENEATPSPTSGKRKRVSSDERNVKQKLSETDGVRRPTWDLKGRLADMEELVTMLKGEINQSKANVSSITSQLGSSRRGPDGVLTPTRSLAAIRAAAAARSSPKPATPKGEESSSVDLSSLRAEVAAVEEARKKLEEENHALSARLKDATASADSGNAASAAADDKVRVLEDTVEDLKIQLEAKAATAEEMEATLSQLKGEVAASAAALDKARAEEGEKSAKLEAAVALAQEQKVAAEEQCAALKEEVATMKAEVSRLTEAKEAAEAEAKEAHAKAEAEEQTVAALRIEKQEVEAECARLTEHAAEIEARASSALEEVQGLTAANSEKDAEIQRLLALVEKHERKVAELKQSACEDELVRRDLHNTILELKGNIRVFCRIRPLLGDEQKQTGIPFSFEDLGNQKLTIEAPGKAFDFKFDKVFTPASRQADVFHDISQLVQSALDGYNVCIFAYGQTGSGKTYTMEGAGDCSSLSEESGMIPRAVWQVFGTAEALAKKGWDYTFEASYLEIYNETIYDLLGDPRKRGQVKHEIKYASNAAGSCQVTNLTNVAVSRPEEVQTLLSRAAKSRSVASTDMNDQSSRSHSVFMLRLAGTNKNGMQCTGVLNLIDLAGSERLNKSGVTGERAKEAMAINKSLSALSDVMVALGSKASHVPYRNSKLTYLLKNSLGGSSKMLMFANLSPLEESIQESLCSLRFAVKVNSVELGKAARNVYKRKPAEDQQ